MLFRFPRSRLTGYLVGATCSRIGDEMTAPALLLLALLMASGDSGGPILVAVLTATSALGGPLLGGFLDRSTRPFRFLAATLLSFGVLLAVTGGLVGRSPLVAVAGVVALAGLFRPALAGGWSARLPGLADRPPTDPSAHRPESAARTGRAIALDGVSFDVATLVGPALVTLLAVGIGRGWAFAAAVLLIMLGAPMAWQLDRRVSGLRPHTAARRPTVPAGLHAIATIPRLRRATAVSVISYVGLGMLTTSVPQLGRDVLGAADRGPMILAVAAVAALSANGIYARHPQTRPETVLVASTAVMSVATALVAAAAALATDADPSGASIVLLFVAMMIIGSGDGPQLVALMRIRHREATDRVRSQVFTTGASLKLGGLALGAALSALLLSWSLADTLLVAAGCQLIGTAIQLRR